MIKLVTTYLLIISSVIGFSQNSLRVRKNNIIEIDYVIKSSTDSVNITSQTTLISLQGTSHQYCFFKNKVFIFDKPLSEKLKKHARNNERFQKKIAKLKQRKKIDFISFDITIKELMIIRNNINTENGYAYYKINTSTNDTLIKKIIPPKNNLSVTEKYTYEITINGEKFSSAILYNNPIYDNELVNTLANSINKKIRKTIPLGTFKANKKFKNKKWHIIISEYNYFDKNIKLVSNVLDHKSDLVVAYKIKGNEIDIESDIEIFLEKGKYNKRAKKFEFKHEKSKITFKQK